MSAFDAIASSRTLFGSAEVKSKSSDLKPFPKWTGVLSRYREERPLEKAQCKASLFGRCHLQDWRSHLQKISHLNKREKIDAVQRYVNGTRYVLDPVNWGVPDYWTTPKQFFIKNGDCEDYAITKFISLKALGFSADDMRIVVLQDLNLNLMHSVLVVYLDGTPLVLDNQIRNVVPANKIYHYRPIYSLNDKEWWRYRS